MDGWRLRINRQEEGQGKSNFGLARPDWTDEHACILRGKYELHAMTDR
jgi:hypothetical protein